MSIMYCEKHDLYDTDKHCEGCPKCVENTATVLYALEEALEFIEGYVDVVDGDYGIPEPNRAMRLQQALQDAVDVLS